MKLSKKIKNPKAIIIMGPPGSGKGTQAKLLSNKFKLEYVGSGDALRSRNKINDFTGKKLKEIMHRGGLAPSFVVMKVLGDTLEKIKKQKKVNGVVLDGWTRIVTEAIMVDESLNWYGWEEKMKVLLINISAKEAFNRLTKRRQCKDCGQLIPWIGEFKELKKCNKCGGKLFNRSDDNIKSIKKRLEEYRKETIPSINYYKKQRRIIEINGEQSIENVFKDISKALK